MPYLDISANTFHDLSMYIRPGMSELSRAPVILAQDVDELKSMNTYIDEKIIPQVGILN